MRHRYLCPLRWGDLDQLGHVNNVRYVDYLQEARSALLHDCLVAAGLQRRDDEGFVVIRHEVTFLAPMMFSVEPVVIESWVTEVRAARFTLDHEIFHEHADGTRTVYLRARTVLGAFVPLTGAPRRLGPEEKNALAPYAAQAQAPSRPVVVDVAREHAAHYPVHVRFSDIDVYRHVNNVQYFEFFQEARISLFLRLREALRQFPRINVVVAQADLEYLAPMALRYEPYDCWSVVSRIGNKSMVIESEICDGTGGDAGGRALARSRVVLVFFDVTTQRSVAPPEGYREAMVEALGRAVTT